MLSTEIITKIEYNKNIIIYTKNNNYIIKVNKGIINCDIITNENENVSLKYLEIGDTITIDYVIKQNTKNNNSDNHILNIINKILIQTKYNILSDSSEE
jgi:hypothetical protein